MVATGAVHLVVEGVFEAKAAFVLPAAAAWLLYAALRIRRERGAPAEWGLRRAGFRPSALAAGAVAAAGALLLAAVAALQGTFAVHVHMLPLFLLYPLWGLAQQFLVQAMVARNLARASGPLGCVPAVTAVAALLFAIAHFPDLPLMGATFLLGLFFTPIYLRWRNLWPLGVLHGWLGVLCYWWLLGRDPWAELTGAV